MPKRRDVKYTPAALDDLQSIFDYLADQADTGVADRYLDRIQNYIGGFDLFAERGARRDDLRPGVRLIGFEKRVTILFEVRRDDVIIIAIAYGGQDIDARFGGEDA